MPRQRTRADGDPALFTELIPRLASIELNGEVTRVRSNFINGIKFPVRVETN